MPTAIPYVTSYYKETWGFCISQDERDTLEDGEYHLSSLSSVHETPLLIEYGEIQQDAEIITSHPYTLPPDSDREIEFFLFCTNCLTFTICPPEAN